MEASPHPAISTGWEKTKDLRACIRSGTPRYLVPRALDDTPCVAPEGSDMIDRFSVEMKKVCEEANIPLAEFCPQAEKAFELVTRGTVLGIVFNSSTMTWHLSKEKADKIVRRCVDGINAVHMDLNQIQKLMGSVNDLVQMSPLLKFHKRTGNAFLKSFEGSNNLLKLVPQKLKEDLSVIAKVAEYSVDGLPVADRPVKPPLTALYFYTDAAGASFTVARGKKFFHDNEGKGVGCICGSSLENIWGWSRVEWPEGLLTVKTDEKGCLFGHKTTTLESVGLLLPLLAFPDELAGKELIFKVDNVAVLWGWNSGYVKNDETATYVLKSVSYLAGYLGVIIHVDRMSKDLAALADEMSRRRVSKSEENRQALERAVRRPVRGYLNKWLEDPCGMGDPCHTLLKELKTNFLVNFAEKILMLT